MQEKFLSFSFLIMFGWMGLLVILFARLIQINYSWKGRRDLQLSFLLLQGIGAFFLVIHAFSMGEILSAFLYILVTGAAIWTYFRIKK